MGELREDDKKLCRSTLIHLKWRQNPSLEMLLANSHLKGNIGESLVGAALVEELVSLGDGAGYFPLYR